jgi:hypothetical protein
MAANAIMMGAANEKASPFIAAGSMIGMFNPLAGVAVAGAGTAATAETSAGGALAGGVAGAALGTMILPGLGTAIGAGIGALAGGVIGAINSGNKLERENEARGRGAMMYGAGRAGTALVHGGRAGVARQMREEENNIRRARTNMSAIFASTTEAERARYSGDYSANGGVRSGEVAAVTGDPGARKIERDRLEAAKRAGTLTRDEIAAVESGLGGHSMNVVRDYLTGLENTANEMERSLIPITHNYETNLERLSDATGQSREDLAQLAQQMGVDLTGKVYSLSEALDALGQSVPKTKEEINSLARDSIAKAVTSYLRPLQEQADGIIAMNQATETVRQQGGFGDDSELFRYIETMVGGHLSFYKDDPAFAIGELQRQFIGEEGAPGVAFQEGGILANVALPPEFMSTLAQAIKLAGDGAIDQTATWFAAFVSERTENPATDTELSFGDQVTTALQALDNPEDRTALLTAISALNAKFTDEGFLAALEGKGQIEQGVLIKDTLAAVGIGVDGFSTTPIQSMNVPEGESADEIRAAINAGMAEGFANPPDWWASGPSWWNAGVNANLNPSTVRINPLDIAKIQGAVASIPGTSDTPTSRMPWVGDTTSSRLATTMTRHGMYDSALAGKRTVTSSLRNHSLGSLNSDHTTGNAYDLTGQNLVGYAAMVNGTGGFAEFHGGTSNRHLHVVPGAPMGDAVSPAPVPVIATGGGGGSTSYNIQIYAGQGQDPNAIANAVLAKIEARDRDARERS